MSKATSRVWATAWLGLIGLLGGRAAAAVEVSLPLYEADYLSTYRFGILSFSAASRSAISWHPDSREYHYSTTVEAKGLAAIKYPDAVSDFSRLMLDCRGIVPLEHRRDDGSKEDSHDVLVRFDVDHARAQSRYGGVDYEFELPPGTVDPQSLPLAVMLDLMQGRAPSTYSALDRDKLKTYEFTALGEEQLDTELGKLATLVFEEGRPGSSRSRKVWFAPELGYVPVRMEYRRKGKTAAVMTIQSLQRPQERAPAVQCEAPPSNALSASEG